MKFILFKLGLKKYLEFIPYYLIGSGLAFTVDLTIFTLLRSNFGTNYSAFIAYIFGTITSFSTLIFITRYRLRKKRIGILIHLLIGLGTLIINLIILNSIDFIIRFYNYSFYTETLNNNNYYALFTKATSSGIGFIWTSSMTQKLLFKKK